MEETIERELRRDKIEVYGMAERWITKEEIDTEGEMYNVHGGGEGQGGEMDMEGRWTWRGR